MFEFYKYQPPFKGINKGATKDNGTALSVYNQSATDAALYKKVDGLQTIILKLRFACFSDKGKVINRGRLGVHISLQLSCQDLYR